MSAFLNLDGLRCAALNAIGASSGCWQSSITTCSRLPRGAAVRSTPPAVRRQPTRVTIDSSPALNRSPILGVLDGHKSGRTATSEQTYIVLCGGHCRIGSQAPRELDRHTQPFPGGFRWTPGSRGTVMPPATSRLASPPATSFRPSQLRRQPPLGPSPGSFRVSQRVAVDTPPGFGSAPGRASFRRAYRSADPG